MTYIAPPEGINGMYSKRYHERYWDGVSPIEPEMLVFYKTDDYITPAVYDPNSRLAMDHGLGVISVNKMEANHADYVTLRDTLTQLGFIGGNPDEDDAIVFKQLGKFSRAVACMPAKGRPGQEIFLLHLLSGRIEGFSTSYRIKTHSLSKVKKATVEVVLSELKSLYNEHKNLLIEYGVESTPRNVRKLLLFRGMDPLHFQEWYKKDEVYTRSVMHFIQAEAPLSLIKLFHTTDPGARENSISRSSAKRRSVDRHSEPLSEEEIRTISALPVSLVQSLYMDSFLVYTPYSEGANN